LANVLKWSHKLIHIDFGKGLTEKIVLDTAILDEDVSCFHCGKNIKSGKMVFCATMLFGGSIPSRRGDSGWGESSRKTFCASNHAKLFAKNNGRV
jgi:hypothetical protein